MLHVDIGLELGGPGTALVQTPTSAEETETQRGDMTMGRMRGSGSQLLLYLTCFPCFPGHQMLHFESLHISLGAVTGAIL